MCHGGKTQINLHNDETDIKTILDTGANTNIFKYGKELYDITSTNTFIDTPGGKVNVVLQGFHPIWGKSLIIPEIQTNIISMRAILKHSTVNFHDNVFIVSHQNGTTYEFI